MFGCAVLCGQRLGWDRLTCAIRTIVSVLVACIQLVTSQDGLHELSFFVCPSAFVLGSENVFIWYRVMNQTSVSVRHCTVCSNLHTTIVCMLQHKPRRQVWCSACEVAVSNPAWGVDVCCFLHCDILSILGATNHGVCLCGRGESEGKQCGEGTCQSADSPPVWCNCRQVICCTQIQRENWPAFTCLAHLRDPVWNQDVT
jgi:hypothetical protein